MVALYKAANTEDNNERMHEFVPTGEYLATAIRSEKVENSKETGHMVVMTFKIIEGEYKGGTIFEYLNFWHPSTFAVQKAWERFNTICYYTKKQGVMETELVHGVPLIVKTVYEEQTEDNPERNRITGYDFAPNLGQQENYQEQVQPQTNQVNNESTINTPDISNTNVDNTPDTTQESTQQVETQTTESTQPLDQTIIQLLSSGMLTPQQVQTIDPSLLELYKTGSITAEQLKSIAMQLSPSNPNPDPNSSQQQTTKSTSLWDD